MNKVLAIYQTMSRMPLGRGLFSQFVARKAPYFGSISPQVRTLEPHHCEVIVRKRRAVQNHIGTVHVIAIANGLEMAMGVMAEASVPPHLRWIPKGMTLSYPAKGATDIRCVARVAPEAWVPGDMDVPVEALDEHGQVVVEGTIRLWISERPERRNAAA